MKKMSRILPVLALFAMITYGCSESDQAQQVGDPENHEAAQGISDALHHMNSLNDSIAHHTGPAVHHYDSLYHHHDSLFVYHHQNYHHGDTVHHSPGSHHSQVQHHMYDSITAVHHHLAH